VEELSLMLGIILMLVAAIGIVFYVALVIAIPVCRLLDWFSDKEPDERRAPPRPSHVTRSIWVRLTGRSRSDRRPNDKD
jgi:hypothetical protein